MRRFSTVISMAAVASLSGMALSQTTNWHSAAVYARARIMPAAYAMGIAKVMCAPPLPSPGEAGWGFADSASFGWLEVVNTGPSIIDTRQLAVEGGMIALESGSITNEIEPGERFYLVRDRAAFGLRYVGGAPPESLKYDAWTGGALDLDNNGARTVTVTRAGETLLSFSYDAAWWPEIRGTGLGLEALDAATPVGGDWSARQAWRPGGMAVGPLTGEYAYGDLRVSGLMAVPHPPVTPQEKAVSGAAADFAWLELVNTGGAEIDLKGLFMTNGVYKAFYTSVVVRAQGRVVLCRNARAYAARYPGETAPVVEWSAGGFATGAAATNGIHLVGPDGVTAFSCGYSLSWYPEVAGTGRWLEPVELPAAAGGDWFRADAWRPSSLPECDYAALRVSRFLYSPLPPGRAEKALGYSADMFEWVELYNAGATMIDLAGVALSGVRHTFAPYLLEAGARLLVVKSEGAFAYRYRPEDDVVYVAWSDGKLADSADRITVCEPAGVTNICFTYSDAWYQLANSGRHLIANDLTVPQTDPWWSTAAAWRPSAEAGFTPGRPETPIIQDMAVRGGTTLELAVGNRDGTVLELLYSPDLVTWTPCAGDAWSVEQGVIKVDLGHAVFSGRSKGFFKVRQR